MTPDIRDSSLWTPQQIDAGARGVQEILTARGLKADLQLPPLNGGLTQPEKDFIQKIVDWIVRHMPTFGISPGSVDPELLRRVAIGAIVVSVCAILVVVAIFISRAARKKNKFAFNPSRGNPSGAFLLDPEERLLKEMRDAQTAGAWPQAARLRWRLHLLRKNLPESATPKEILTDSTLLSKQYLLMFSTRVPDPSAEFQALDQAIGLLERPLGVSP